MYESKTSMDNDENYDLFHAVEHADGAKRDYWSFDSATRNEYKNYASQSRRYKQRGAKEPEQAEEEAEEQVAAVTEPVVEREPEGEEEPEEEEEEEGEPAKPVDKRKLFGEYRSAARAELIKAGGGTRPSNAEVMILARNWWGEDGFAAK
jgi:alpha-ketoglutarate-dependent taurine dioxygenase